MSPILFFFHVFLFGLVSFWGVGHPVGIVFSPDSCDPRIHFFLEWRECVRGSGNVRAALILYLSLHLSKRLCPYLLLE